MYELVMYSRSSGCPYMSIAKKVLDEHQIHYREIFIDKNPDAKQRVLDWTGFLSVPTIVVAAIGQNLPYKEPAYLAEGASPRGVDRGAMITEARASELEDWLKKHGFITSTP